MLRRILITLVVLLTLPAFAHAWYVNAKSSPATGQGTVSPAGTKYYGNGVDSGEYAVAPAAGFKISRVTIDGVAVPLEADNTYVVPYVFGKSYRYLVAYFAANTVNITLDAGPNGGIREDSNESLSNIPAGSSRQLIIAPAAGYAIDTLTADGATVTDNGDGTKTAVYTNLQADQSVAATFALIPVVTANAGPDQTTDGIGAAKAVVLDGSATSNLGAITYAWSGPADLVFATPAAAKTEVYSDLAGSYTATLTVTSGAVTVADDVVVNVLSNVQAIEDECLSCHATRHPIQMAAYDASSHKSSTHAEVSCKACHDSAGSGHYTDAAPYAAGVDAQGCQSCHAAGSPYSIYNIDLTLKAPHGGGTVLAQSQYLSANATCADCHASHNNLINGEYAESGHGNVNGEAWMHYDWSSASRAACTQCHSTTGLINKLTGSTTAVAQMEVLTCKGCHSNVATGEVRPAPAYVDGAKIAMPNYGASNLCATCHSGRESMASITSSTGDFANLSFINSHYLAAAGVLSAGTGYEYDVDNDPLTDNYANVAYYRHDKIGIADPANPTAADNGPCVGCHMSSGTAGAGHTWEVVTTDEITGLTTAINSTVCVGCHSGAHGAALVPGSDPDPLKVQAAADFMNHEEHLYHASMEALESALNARGIYFYAAHPYFYTAPYVAGGTNVAFKNWDAVYPGKGKEVMGAAFNYNLLHHEPGGYAHNRVYVKRLIWDSIDFLDNGIFDGAIDLSAYPDAATYLGTARP